MNKNEIFSHIQRSKAKLLAKASTRQGKNLLTFLVFLVVAAFFWFLMALNDEVEKDYTIEVVINDMPEDITLLSDVAPTIGVTVKDHGRSLLRYDWGNPPKLKLDFSDFELVGKDRIVLREQKMKSMVRDLFNSSTQIAYVKPDSLNIWYTSMPAETLPVRINIDVQASPQHIIYGQITVEPDSVMVFSAQGIPSSIVSISTEEIAARGLSDTTVYELSVVPPKGSRVIPQKVKVTVPVEPLISKKVNTKLSTTNVPQQYNLLPFPSFVDVTYLLPMSAYSNNSFVPSAYVDYRDYTPSKSTIPVKIGRTPDYVKSISVAPTEVEFVIERPVRNPDAK